MNELQLGTGCSSAHYLILLLCPQRVFCGLDQGVDSGVNALKMFALRTEDKHLMHQG